MYIVKKKAIKRVEQIIQILRPNEKYTEGSEEPKEIPVPITLWIEFQPTISEDVDYKKLMQKIESQDVIEVVDKETGKKKNIMSGNYNLLLYEMRTSIKGWSDNFRGEDEEILPFNEENQIAVFEGIRNIPGFFENYLQMYTGVTSKN